MKHVDPFEPPDKPPSTPNEWGIVAILSFFFLTFIGLDLAQDFTPRKLSAVFFLLSWVLLLVVHELGHAASAWLLGWQVSLISIGIGKVRLQITARQTTIEFRTLPLSGFVRPNPTDHIAPRLKFFCIYAAGPGIELLLALLLLLTIGPDKFLQRSDEVAMIAAQSFAAAALIGTLINLIPFSFRKDGETSWSDGMGMIMSWRLPTEPPQQGPTDKDQR